VCATIAVLARSWLVALSVCCVCVLQLVYINTLLVHVNTLVVYIGIPAILLLLGMLAFLHRIFFYMVCASVTAGWVKSCTWTRTAWCEHLSAHHTFVTLQP
jgi:hypothetical protein